MTGPDDDRNNGDVVVVVVVFTIPRNQRSNAWPFAGSLVQALQSISVGENRRSAALNGSVFVCN